MEIVQWSVLVFYKLQNGNGYLNILETLGFQYFVNVWHLYDKDGPNTQEN
jgi:hypothetical protein